MKQQSKNWYILKTDLVFDFGPFSLEELKVFIQNKSIGSKDFVSNSGMKFWISVDEFKNKFDAKTHLPLKGINSAKLKPTKVNRRRNGRYQTSMTVTVNTRNAALKGTCIDVSSGGMKLRIERGILEIKEKLKIQHEASDIFPAFESTCEIVFAVGEIYGVKFLKVPKNIVNIIKDRLKTVEKKSRS